MDLISRCRAGDDGAFAALYDRHKNLVYRTAILMLDDPQDAEDVLQEVFIRVYRSLASYDPSKGAFTTWLHRVTVNTCLNRRRHRQRGPRLLSMGQVEPGRLAQEPPSVERVAEDRAMQRALRGLSDKLRATVVLRYGWDLSYAEIAQVLDLPIGTVKSRLHQALTTLRAELGPEDDEAALPGALRHEEAKANEM
jgi:RNA polymerase sigma-70 factor (ECF subfamily)